VNVGGREVDTVAVADPVRLSAFRGDFDTVAGRLRDIPRLHLEPDGWFILAGKEGLWQVQGVVHDQGQQVGYLELKGTCDLESLQQIIGSLDVAIGDLLFQLASEGLFVAWPSFQRMVTAKSTD
jgi:hypothetical protein